MRVDAEAAGPCWATNGDPRITDGAFICATRLDEVPQLLNVLRGEMSLVGPRPERPHFAGQLATIIPRYDERVSVLPEITGWAQINYPYGASVADARAKLTSICSISTIGRCCLICDSVRTSPRGPVSVSALVEAA